MPRLMQDTDAYILMQFRDAVAHLKGKPLTDEHKVEVGKVALPFHKRLLEVGNSPRESTYLLQAVYEGD